MKKQAVRVSEQQAYDELCDYTIAHARQHGTFIHQHVVDAYAAQHADSHTKSITLVFALTGLYMHVERGYTGTEVQRLQIAMGRSRIAWPPLKLPFHRGAMTVMDVMAFPPGPERDHAINAWCRSVWEAFAINRPTIAELLVAHRIG